MIGLRRRVLGAGPRGFPFSLFPFAFTSLRSAGLGSDSALPVIYDVSILFGTLFPDYLGRMRIEQVSD